MRRSLRFAAVCLSALSSGVFLFGTVSSAWATPPNPPTLNPYNEITSSSSQWFSGTRDPYTEVWLNGSRVVFSSSFTTWTKSVSLSQGNNQLTWTCKNSSGEFSSPVVINVLRDSTAPTDPVITDDGATTSNGAQLHATWTTDDPESGVAYCELKIGTGAGLSNVLPLTNVGNVREYTATGLTLQNGQKYYFSVKAYNHAGKYTFWKYSDGITYEASQGPNQPPVIQSAQPGGGWAHAGGGTSLSIAAADPEGDALQYRFLVDGVEVRTWSSSGSTTWTPGASDAGERMIRFEVKDTPGGVATQETHVYVVHEPVSPPVF